MIPGSGRGEFHEGIEVHGGADRIRPQAGGGRFTGCGSVPQGRYQRRHVLQLAEEVRGPVAHGDDPKGGEAYRLRQLEEENAKLKRIVADLSLDKAMLQDVLQKKL
jgi:hypothetical protein